MGHAAPFQTQPTPQLPPGAHRRGYYAIARDWMATPRDVRAAVHPATACHYKMIERLEPEWGQRLDDLHATLSQIRWVAGACGPANLTQRQARYAGLVAWLEGGGHGRRSFERLAATFPKVGRQATKERRRREEAVT